MVVRGCIAAALALALSSCTWLTWPQAQRPPAPIAPARTVPARTPEVTTAPPASAPAARAAEPSPAPPRSSQHAKPRPATPVPRTPAPASARTTKAEPKPDGALELHGRVQLRAGHGQQLHPGEAVDTVVWFVPAAGMPPPRPQHASIVTAHRDFKPTALALPRGSRVTFVNHDSVRHNVFSVTPGAAFNLGYQAAGTSVDHVFTKPGLVLISCNVHHSMELDVFVVPSPYAGKVAADGSFVLRGLPAGPGELFAWNPRARVAHRAVTVPDAEAVTLPLLAERPRVVTRIDVRGGR